MDKKLGSKFFIDSSLSCAFALKQDNTLTDEEIVRIEKLLGCRFSRKDGIYYFLYIETTIYRFPEWVRKPISACIRCYASVYGSFIWWVFVYLQKDAFNWCSNKIIAILTFWIIFIVVLSGVNVFFNKKMKE
jgi:hypothetical protein